MMHEMLGGSMPSGHHGGSCPHCEEHHGEEHRGDEDHDDEQMMQRIQFVDIEADSFTWLSEFSQDGGQTWITFMRMRARRLR